MTRPKAGEFIREALIGAVDKMLEELGHPPLVDKIFPDGWRNAPTEKIRDLYDLCIRTFAKREKETAQCG